MDNSANIVALKYLPIDTFKNVASLLGALDLISLQINPTRRNRPKQHLHLNEKNSMLVNLAKNIALTTLDLNIDYAAKLALIHASTNHRLFRPRKSFKQYVHSIARHIRHARNFIFNSPSTYHSAHRTDAQEILDAAKANIRKSRNNIILC